MPRRPAPISFPTHRAPRAARPAPQAARSARRASGLVAAALVTLGLSIAPTTTAAASARPADASAHPADAAARPAGSPARPAAAALGGPYVALGDSYTSGPGIEPQDSTSGLCARSTKNYPALVAAAITPTVFRDVSCGGSVVSSFTSSFLGAPPQFDAVTTDTALVTVGIGGNDIGFIAITATCAALFFLDSNGAPCKNLASISGTDSNLTTMDTWAPKLGTALDTIRQRAPKAKILVVGYPDLLPPTKAQCPRGAPFATGDMPYLHGLNTHLNTLIKTQAAAHGATYVDTFTSSIGHDMCQEAGIRWVEGLVDVQGAASVHPNALGMRNDADQVLAALS